MKISLKSPLENSVVGEALWRRKTWHQQGNFTQLIVTVRNGVRDHNSFKLFQEISVRTKNVDPYHFQIRVINPNQLDNFELLGLSHLFIQTDLSQQTILNHLTNKKLCYFRRGQSHGWLRWSDVNENIGYLLWSVINQFRTMSSTQMTLVHLNRNWSTRPRLHLHGQQNLPHIKWYTISCRFSRQVEDPCWTLHKRSWSSLQENHPRGRVLSSLKNCEQDTLSMSVSIKFS